MSDSLKLVYLGGAAEISQLMRDQAAFFDGAKIEAGEISGARVLRFRGNALIGEKPQSFTLYGLDGEPDHRGVFSAFLSNADGLIGVIPSHSAQGPENLRTLGVLQKARTDRQTVGSALPFVLQYHWGPGMKTPAPEEVDRNLGVNAQVVERVLTFADASDQVAGVYAILNKCLQQSAAMIVPDAPAPEEPATA